MIVRVDGVQLVYVVLPAKAGRAVSQLLGHLSVNGIPKDGAVGASEQALGWWDGCMNRQWVGWKN